MPRSSRHKSSKHSSRDAREYSDSEKDSGFKDRKSKEESGVVRVSKDSGSSEKRKLDLKDGKDSYGGSANGDYSEDLVSSKRRKERVDDGGSDRWNGGEDDHRRGGEGSKKSLKAPGESKSKKRGDSVEWYAEGVEVKKSTGSSGKGEGKHRDRDREKDRDKDLIRKEGKEGGVAEKEREREREKKVKDGRTERLVSSDEQRVTAKQVINEKTDLNAREELESPDSENQIEKRMRKRRDDFGDGDKHLDDVEDISGGRLSSRDDSGRDSRQKDEKRKDERYRERHREDMERDNKHRDDKQRDERPTKDHPSSKSDDKHLRDEKDLTEMQQKRSKIQDGERKLEHDRDRNRDRDSYHVRDRDRYHDREHGWDHGRDRDYDRDWEWDRERDGDRERDRNHDRDRGRDRDRDGDRDRDRDYDREYDGSHLDDRSTRYKDSSRGKKRSPDDRDDCSDTKSRGIKARYSDLEKKSSSGDRVESDVNKGRSQLRQAYVDTILSGNKRRTSPSSNSHIGIDEYRYLNPEDLKYRDSVAEHRSKAIPPRDGSGPASERGSKYRSMEKPIKTDDGHLGELPSEKSSSSKASPLALMERSPSSSSIDRRYMNRTGVRRSLDIEETGRRSNASIDNRDFNNTEDRISRDLPSEKPLADESSPADSSAHNRSSQSNLSLFPPHPNFRAGVDSPSFVGSMEEDGRVNSNARYRRSDPNLVRGHGNAWRGVPSWNSPVPNGFMHFQHGAPHGGFQGMMPQFPTPPLFGVRPSMEINHSGIPYHISDADRFSSHLRPLGWQNMMDGSGPSHLHLWDGNNGAFRDETHMYGGAEWDQNRHPMNARGWESGGETWKVHNNDVKRELASPAQKDDYPVQAPVDDPVAGKAGQMSHHEDNLDLHAKTFERSIVTSPLKEPTPKLSHVKSPGSSKSPNDDVPCLSHYYLSKLDISAELAHSDVYSQCMSILDTEGSATDEDAMHTILEGARAGLKSSKTLLSSSLFPPLKDSVFQKAMNLYKKQRMEIRGLSFVDGGALDIILAYNQENKEAKFNCDVEKLEEVVPTSDVEMADAPLSSLVEKNVGTSVTDTAEEEKVEVLLPVSTLNGSEEAEVQNHTCLPSPELEMPVEDYSESKGGEPQTILLNGVEIESSEQEKLEVGNANGLSSPDNESLATAPLPAEDDNSIYHAKEGAADAITGGLIIPEGSPKACEALMPGSNESDSVILSRIHHSPESTH